MLDILDNNPQVQKIATRDSLKPGDMMVYWTPNGNKRDIPHAQVYLDKGILFEKENRGPNNFRMFYNPVVRNDNADDLKLLIYRFNRNSPLKGTDIFGNEYLKTPLIFVSSPYIFDDLGRASLSLPEETRATATNNPVNPSGTNSNTNTDTNISNTSSLPANPSGTNEVLPAMTEGCDYTDAGKPENMGYGYNPNLQKSCAPKSS